MIRPMGGIRRWLLPGVALACLASAANAEEPGLHRVWAVTGAKVVTMIGPPLEAGTVVIRDGLIEAVGIGIAVPADAEVIDGKGLSVYPGLIDALGESLLKMPERKAPQRSSSGQYSEEERGLTPLLHAWEHANLGKAALSKHHNLGITAAQVMPTAGLLPGQAAVLSLSNEDKRAAVLLRDTALGVTFTPGLGYPNSLFGVVAFIRQEMADATFYGLASTRWASNPVGVLRPEYNARYELEAKAASGQLPVIFVCANQHDIRRALRLASELKLNALIADRGGEAFRALPELRKAGARVLVSVTYKAPSSALWSQQADEDKQKAEKELYPSNAKQLNEAGVPFAFASLGSDSPEALIAGVKKAVEAGLPAERALQVMTIDAARLLGASKLLGTIEVGKVANLVVTEGELLGKNAKVKVVFADGTRFAIKERKLKDGDKPTVNVTGRWELTQERGMGAGMKSTVSFTQEEASLSGTFTSMLGSIDFSDGEVAGNQIAFELSLSFGGRSMEMFVSGTVEGDTIRGTVTTGRGSNPFTAKRLP
jgi:imidazolonepropionase-like amidohydrolase